MSTKKHLQVYVEGLDCPECALSLEKAINQLPQVERAKLVFTTSQLAVTAKGDQVPLEDIRQTVANMGYRLRTAANSSKDEPKPFWQRRSALTVLSGILLLAAFGSHLLGGPIPLSNALYSLAILAGGFPIAKAGWAAILQAHSLDMNVLMTIAALGAMAVGEFAEGAVTVFLFSIGELLESYSADRARSAIRKLMELAPEEATVLRNGQEIVVPVEELQVGERILVRPGERIPADGEVLEGQSDVDQSPITGESIPVEKAPGDQVFAGTMNGNGALIIQVSHVAADSTLAQVMRLIEKAQSQQAPAQRFVDRFARLYTPIMTGIALFIALLPPFIGLGTHREWIYRALVLLVISCPCALVISTPVTIVSALARAARSGVLIKGGKYLEALASVRVIAFDKTGTLTQGKPRVISTGCPDHSPRSLEECAHCQDLVAKAAALESRSEHALAQAVLQYAEDLAIEAEHQTQKVTAVPGMGIHGIVDGHQISVGKPSFSPGNLSTDALAAEISAAEQKGYTVLLIQDACCGRQCYMTVSDTLRPGVGEAIQKLKELGIAQIVMLTGDNPHIAQRMGNQVGIDRVHAGLLPEDKIRIIEELEKEFGPVAMVGDGVNDAPALAKATVGIAMGAAGTDVALETADVALMGDDLQRLPFVIQLGRQALRIVRTNVAFSLFIKALFLALAVGGMASLWMAVLADTGASLLVSLNGLRMLRFRIKNAED